MSTADVASCSGCGGMLYDIDDWCSNCDEWGSLAGLAQLVARTKDDPAS